jgi:opacity protein-like surface antigen
MKKILAAALIGASSVSLSAVAQENDISYNYIQAAYGKGEVDVEGYDFDFDVAGLSGSFAITDSLFLRAAYGRAESEMKFLGAKIELDNYEIGLGYRYGLAARTDLVLGASWIRSEAGVDYDEAVLFATNDFANISASESGYSLDAGFRHLLTSQFEVGASIIYSDIADDDGVELSFGALYHFANTFSVGAGYTAGEDSSVWSIGARLNF